MLPSYMRYNYVYWIAFTSSMDINNISIIKGVLQELIKVKSPSSLLTNHPYYENLYMFNNGVSVGMINVFNYLIGVVRV